MKLSASVYVSEFLPHKVSIIDRLIKPNIFAHRDVKKVFSQLKEADFDGIELMLVEHLSEQDLQNIKKILQKNGITVFSIHEPITILAQRSLKSIEQLFVTAQQMGASVMTIHLSSLGKNIFDPKYVKKLHDLQKRYKVTIGFENHQKNIIMFNRPYLWDEKKYSGLLEKNDLKMTLDTTHLATVKKNMVEFFTEHKDSIVNIHLSDYKDHALRTTLQPTINTHMPVGQGILPIKKFIQTLKKNNYKGIITLEVSYPLKDICESARRIRQFEALSS